MFPKNHKIQYLLKEPDRLIERFSQKKINDSQDSWSKIVFPSPIVLFVKIDFEAAKRDSLLNGVASRPLCRHSNKSEEVSLQFEGGGGEIISRRRLW